MATTDQPLEVETKLELNERDFWTVLSNGLLRKRAAQLNVYFDSDWRLASISATCRIRLGGDLPRLTLKLPVAWHGGTRVMRELEESIDIRSIRSAAAGSVWRKGLEVQSHLPEHFRGDLLRLGLSRLECVGWTRNTRYLVTFGDFGEIELDALRLPNGRRVYEAEIEHFDCRVHGRLVALLRSLAPSAQPSTVSKFERFRRAVTNSSQVPRAFPRP